MMIMIILMIIITLIAIIVLIVLYSAPPRSCPALCENVKSAYLVVRYVF